MSKAMEAAAQAFLDDYFGKGAGLNNVTILAANVAMQSAVTAYLAAREAEGFKGQLIKQTLGAIAPMAKEMAALNQEPDNWRAYEDDALFAQEAYHKWLAANGFVVLAARPTEG